MLGAAIWGLEVGEVYLSVTSLGTKRALGRMRQEGNSATEGAAYQSSGSSAGRDFSM